VRILNKTRDTNLASQAELSDTVFSRLKGLLGRTVLPEGHALIITDCRSIHMLFMRFAIDVVFADREYRVVGLVENIMPFRISPYFWKAYYAIELPTGTIRMARIEKGDQLLVTSEHPQKG
jgi:uncharacterized protein